MRFNRDVSYTSTVLRVATTSIPRVELRANTMIQDAKFGIFARSERTKLLLNCYTVAMPRRRRLPICAATLPRPVCESSFWAPKEVYETSHIRIEWSHIMLTHISPHSIELECCCFYLSYCNRKRSQLSPFVGTADDIDIFVDFICNCWCEKIIIIILLSWCRQNPEPSVQCKFERTDLWFVLVDNDASAAVIVVDLLRVVGHRTCSMTRYSRPADGCCQALVPWLLTTADMAAERWRHCALPHSPATGQWSSTNVKRKSSCGRTRVRRSCPLN